MKKQKRMNRFISSLIVSILLVISVLPVKAFSEQSLDEFLLSKGMMQEEINIMSQEQKEYIRETLDENAQFSSYERQFFKIKEDGTLEVIKETKGGGSIASSDLTLSVAAFSTTYNGESCYSIYPSFVWSKTTIVKNDSFAMALYPNWEIIPDMSTYNMRLWMKNIYGNRVQYVDLRPDTSNHHGFSYKIPSNTGGVEGMYEGNAVFYAKKTSSSATRGICLKYIHDTTSLLTYSVSIGPISILVSDPEKVYTMSGLFTF